MSIQEYYSSECFLYTLCWKHRSYVIPCMLALIYQSIDLLTYFSQPSKLCTGMFLRTLSYGHFFPLKILETAVMSM